MASLNKVFIMGNLGRDPELRNVGAQQTPRVTLNVASTEYRNKDGVLQKQTEWHNIVVWGKMAENSAKYLRKGSSVLVEGKIQTRSWEDNGQKKYMTEIVASNVQFLRTGQSSSSNYDYPSNSGETSFSSTSGDIPQTFPPQGGDSGSLHNDMSNVPF